MKGASTASVVDLRAKLGEYAEGGMNRAPIQVRVQAVEALLRDNRAAIDSMQLQRVGEQLERISAQLNRIARQLERKDEA